MTYIIAEVGSNWTSLDDCFQSIRLAKLAGSDAVKFQLYDFEALYGMKQRDFVREQELKGVLTLDWIPKLKACADRNQIDFLCSAFSPAFIEAVDPYVKIHKLASAELSHVRMLETLAKIGKPVLLSVGASGHSDIEQALHILGRNRVTLMYCVSAYPAREVDLDYIPLLRHHFGCSVGFSDHTLDIYNIPKFAVQYYGAPVLEKHFTYSKDLSTPDVGHSLDFDEFKCLVDAVRRRTIDHPTGTGNGNEDASRMYTYRSEEKDMILKHNRRLIATQDIPKGENLVEGMNFGIYRSLHEDTHAFSGFMIDAVNHKIAARTIIAGEGIGPGDTIA